MEKILFEIVDHYIDGLFAEEDQALANVVPSLDEAGMPQISVSPNQGKFLQVMAMICKAKNILEVGTLGGYSTIWMARALPEDGKLVTLELEPLHAEVAQRNIDRTGLGSRVEIRIGNALETLPQLLNENAGPFDMIFIDADKISYPEYFKHVLSLAHSGTVIIADHVVRKGAVIDSNSRDQRVIGVRRFHSMVSQEKRVSATIMQLVGIKGHDGMAVMVVRCKYSHFPFGRIIYF